MSMLLSCCCERLVTYAGVPMLTDLTVGSGTRESGNYLNSGSKYANWGIATEEEPFEVTYTTEINTDTTVPGENPLGIDPATQYGYKTAHPDNILRPRRLTAIRLNTGCYPRIQQSGGSFIIGSTAERLAGGRQPSTYQVFIDGVANGPVQTVDGSNPWNGGALVFTPPVVNGANPFKQYHVSVVCTFEPRAVGAGQTYDRDIIPYGSSTLSPPLLRASYDLELSPFSVRTTTTQFPGVNTNRIFAQITGEIWANSFWRVPGTAARSITSPWYSRPADTTPTYGLYDGTTTDFFQAFITDEFGQLAPGNPAVIRTASEYLTRDSYNPWGFIP